MPRPGCVWRAGRAAVALWLAWGCCAMAGTVDATAGAGAAGLPGTTPPANARGALGMPDALGMLGMLGMLDTAAAAPQQAVWPLALRQGDLVQGELGPPQALSAALDLLDAQGRHVRRLVAPGALQRDFMFVAPADGRYALAVRRPDAADPKQGQEQEPVRPLLSQLRVLPLAAQAVLPQQPASERLRLLQARLDDSTKSRRAATRQGLLDAFWAEVARQGAPLVESLPGRADWRRVTFVWCGARYGVRVMASPSGDHDDMRLLPGSDVWYASYEVPASTRLGYKLAPDVPALPVPAGRQQRRAMVATAQRDPLNPRWMTDDGHVPLDRFDGQSVLELPLAPSQPWLARRPGVARGTLERQRIASQLLGNERDVYLYRPAGWRADPRRASAAQNLLVVFDAHLYTRAIPLPDILDNLIAEGWLAPTAAIVIASPSAEARARELPPNPLFARFLAEELMPWARRQGVAAPARRTVVAGASYGGLAAAYVAMKNPAWFGHVLSQSGSFWWPRPEEPKAAAESERRGVARDVARDGERPDRAAARRESARRDGARTVARTAGAADEPAGWLTREFARLPRLPLKFYLEAGLFEGQGADGIPVGTRHLRDVLQARGYAVRYAQYASGHDALNWRGSLACGLIALRGPAEADMTPAQRPTWRAACPGRY